MAVIGDSLMLWEIRPPLGVRHVHNNNNNNSNNNDNGNDINNSNNNKNKWTFY